MARLIIKDEYDVILVEQDSAICPRIGHRLLIEGIDVYVHDVEDDIENQICTVSVSERKYHSRNTSGDTGRLMLEIKKLNDSVKFLEKRLKAEESKTKLLQENLQSFNHYLKKLENDFR